MEIFTYVYLRFLLQQRNILLVKVQQKEVLLEYLPYSSPMNIPVYSKRITKNP